MAEQKVTIIVAAKDLASKAFGTVSSGLKAISLAPFKIIGKGFTGIKDGLFNIKSLIAGGAFAASIKKFNDLWVNQNEVLKQTEAVLKSTGNQVGLTADEINKMAGELQKVTNFGDEVTQSGQNILLTFTKIGKDVFPQATEAMLNISQSMKTDVKSSAIQLGKALNNPIEGLTALSRAGIQFTDDQKNTIKALQETGDIAGAQKIILKELETQFGGSARAAADSGKQMANALGDVGETIGKSLKPLWDVLTKAITDFATGPVIGVLAGNLEKAILFIIDNFSDLKKTFAGLVKFFATGFNKISEFTKIFAISLEEIIKRPFSFSTYKSIFTALIDRISDLATGAIELSKNLISKGIGAISDFRKKLFSEEEAEQITFEDKVKKIKDESKAKQIEIEKNYKAEIDSLNDEELKAKKTLELEKIKTEQEAADERVKLAQDEAAKKAAANEDFLSNFSKGMDEILKNMATDVSLSKSQWESFYSAIADTERVEDSFKVLGDGVKKFLINQVIAWMATESAKATAAGLAAAIPTLGASLAIAASQVAGIAAAGATAVTAINSVKFADGGIVPGSSFTGDKITAGLNSGEMVLNRDQQAKLFNLANGKPGIMNDFRYQSTGSQSPQAQMIRALIGASGDNRKQSNTDIIKKLNSIEQAIREPKQINLNGDSFTKAVYTNQKRMLRNGQLNTKG